MAGRLEFRMIGRAVPAAVLAALLPVSAAAQQAADAAEAATPALLPAEEVARRLADASGMEVLRVRAAELDGTPVYLVTLMHPGGNSNAAFRVATVVADARTGALVPSFRHHASGYALPPAGFGGSTDFAAEGRSIRQQTFRTPQ